LKQLLLNALSSAPIPRLLQRLLGRSGISVFTYHAVIEGGLLVGDWSFLPAVEFERQMSYLAQHFFVLPLDKAFELQAKGELPKGKPVAAVTFDDGFHNNYSVALPILMKYSIPATIFLATDFVDFESTELSQPENTLWFCKLHSALIAAMQGSEVSGKTSFQWCDQAYSIATKEDCQATSFRLQQTLKSLPAKELEHQVSNICQQLGVGAVDLSAFKMLDKKAIDGLQASGLILFGAHTGSHAILARLTPQEQDEEIGRSVAAVTTMTGQRCRVFAYPNGGRHDYNDETVRIL